MNLIVSILAMVSLLGQPDGDTVLEGNLPKEITQLIFTPDFRNKDTVSVTNGHFRMTVPYENYMYFVSAQYEGKTITNKVFIRKGDHLQLSLDKRMMSFKVTESAVNEEYGRWLDVERPHKIRKDSIIQDYFQKMRTQKGDSLIFATRKIFKAEDEAVRMASADYIRNHPSSPIAMILLYENHLNDWDELCQLYDVLDEQAKANPMNSLVEPIVNEKRVATEGERIDFEFTDQYGMKHKLSDYRGKYIFIDFWATWCGPCISAMQFVEGVNAQMSDQVQVIGISLDIERTADHWKKMITEKHWDWPQILDLKQIISKQMGVSKVPAQFLINPEGIIVKRTFQETDLTGQIRKVIEENQRQVKVCL